MGPTILLDKSALQSLSENELFALSKFYTLNVPYHLYIEILTDLSKKSKDKDFTTEVIRLANKLNPNEYKVNMHYSELILGELMGEPVPFSYRTTVKVKIEDKITREDGKTGIIIKPTKEELDIERWKIGEFTKEEIELSKSYRDKIVNLELENIKKSYEHHKEKIKIEITEDNFKIFLNNILITSNLSPLEKYDLLETIMNMFHINIDYQNKIKERWYSRQNFDLNTFAPYTMFCHKILMYFGYGLMYDIISTRNSNIIDLEYLFYLPFCYIFSSGDKLHIKSFEYFKLDGQFLLSSVELKEELALLFNELKNEKGNKDFHIPINSKTHKIYEEYRNMEKNLNDDNIDFMMIEKQISVMSPCPCGSGKKLIDCCYNKIISNKGK